MSFQGEDEVSNQTIDQQHHLRDEIKNILRENREHMQVKSFEINEQYEKIPINTESIEKIRSILFISDCLLNVQTAYKDGLHLQHDQLTTWKMFEIFIHQDGNVSVLGQSVGMENLRLMPPKIQTENEKIGTLKVFYLFKAACIRRNFIGNELIREHFQIKYGFQDYHYNIFGPTELQQNINQNFEQFQQLCHHFLLLKIKEREICDFFDLVFECILLGGIDWKIPNSLEEDKLSDNISTGSILEELKSQFDQTQVSLHDIYFEACSWYFKNVASFRHQTKFVEKIIALECGKQIENKEGNVKDIFLADFADNFCFQSFNQIEDQQNKLPICAIKTYFKAIKQIMISEFVEILLVKNLQDYLGNVDTSHDDDSIVLGNKHYDLQDLKTLKPLFRQKVLIEFEKSQNQILNSKNRPKPLNILTYLEFQVEKIKNCWFSAIHLENFNSFDDDCSHQSSLKQGNSDGIPSSSNSLDFIPNLNKSQSECSNSESSNSQYEQYCDCVKEILEVKKIQQI